LKIQKRKKRQEGGDRRKGTSGIKELSSKEGSISLQQDPKVSEKESTSTDAREEKGKEMVRSERVDKPTKKKKALKKRALLTAKRRKFFLSIQDSATDDSLQDERIEFRKGRTALTGSHRC